MKEDMTQSDVENVFTYGTSEEKEELLRRINTYKIKMQLAIELVDTVREIYSANNEFNKNALEFVKVVANHPGKSDDVDNLRIDAQRVLKTNVWSMD